MRQVNLARLPLVLGLRQLEHLLEHLLLRFLKWQLTLILVFEPSLLHQALYDGFVEHIFIHLLVVVLPVDLLERFLPLLPPLSSSLPRPPGPSVPVPQIVHLIRVRISLDVMLVIWISIS